MELLFAADKQSFISLHCKMLISSRVGNMEITPFS